MVDAQADSLLLAPVNIKLGGKSHWLVWRSSDEQGDSYATCDNGRLLVLYSRERALLLAGVVPELESLDEETEFDVDAFCAQIDEVSGSESSVGLLDLWNLLTDVHNSVAVEKTKLYGLWLSADALDLYDKLFSFDPVSDLTGAYRPGNSFSDEESRELRRILGCGVQMLGRELALGLGTKALN
jgi:hypothetical protein